MKLDSETTIARELHHTRSPSDPSFDQIGSDTEQQDNSMHEDSLAAFPTQVTQPVVVILGDDETDDDEGTNTSQSVAVSSTASIDAKESDQSCSPCSSMEPADAYCGSSPNWIVRIFGLLVVFLHLRLHLGVRACNFLLSVMKIILTQLGQLASHDPMPITIQTMMKHLHMEDTFTVFPLCPTCLRLYASNSPGDRKCEVCLEPLYVKQTQSLANLFTSPGTTCSTSKGRLEPRLAMPISPLSSLLADFLMHEGAEEAVGQWSRQNCDDEVLNDIMDGEIWKTLKAADGTLCLCRNRLEAYDHSLL